MRGRIFFKLPDFIADDDPTAGSEDAGEKPDVTPDNETDDKDETPEEKLISQAELDRIVQKRLKRQEDQLKKQYADYDKIKEEAESFRKLQDEKSTDAERWEKEREKFLSDLRERDEKLSKLERNNLIADLATDRGLPKSLWKRVSGDSEDDIAEDIDSLIKDLGLGDKPKDEGGGKTPRARKALHGGGGEGEDPDPDTDELVSRIPRGPQLRIDKPRSYK